MARIRAAQQLTPEQRILAGIEQSELAIHVARDGIRDKHPEATAMSRKTLSEFHYSTRFIDADCFRAADALQAAKGGRAARRVVF